MDNLTTEFSKHCQHAREQRKISLYLKTGFHWHYSSTKQIKNAMKHHSRSQNQAKLSGQDQGKDYKFSVANNGYSILPEHHYKMFVNFQTLEACICKENTGICLAIAKQMMETTGGRITLDSISGTSSNFGFTWHK
ncbi:ATP-binding protein [Halotia wernerae UHCC 0503]|nr:ATP-binding protein [Halotia wernerae UHCC 0503]